MTTEQVTPATIRSFLRFGRDDLNIPEPLAGLLPT